MTETLRQMRLRMTRDYLKSVLAETGGNVERAMALAKVHRGTFYYYLRKSEIVAIKLAAAKASERRDWGAARGDDMPFRWRMRA